MTDFSGFTLVPATPEQILEYRKCTYAQWSRGRPLTDYLQRDKFLDTLDHAKDDKMTTWVLVPRNNHTTLDFKCACETYKRIGIIVQPFAEGNASLSETTAYGIASVYTPPENRRKGYASHMMRLLHWVLAPLFSLLTFPQEWGSPPPTRYEDAQFSALYSDVGNTFYHNAGPTPERQTGWATTSPISTIWHVPTTGTTDPVTGGWQWLNQESAERLWALDAKQMEVEITRMALESGKTTYSFLPTSGVAAFTFLRHTRFTPDLQPIFPPEAWGVQLSVGLEAPSTYATWTFEPVNPRYIVLTRLRASKEMFPALLDKIFEVSRELGIAQVETWNLSQELREIAERLGGKTEARSEHLSCIKWYGPEEAEWHFNEKFCWC